MDVRKRFVSKKTATFGKHIMFFYSFIAYKQQNMILLETRLERPLIAIYYLYKSFEYHKACGHFGNNLHCVLMKISSQYFNTREACNINNTSHTAEQMPFSFSLSSFDS